MQPFQQRVVDEKHELDVKLGKLMEFLNTDVYSKLAEAEKDRLVRQLMYMGQYSKVLGERIAAFE